MFEKTICDRKSLTVFGMEYIKKLSFTCKNPFWQDVFSSYYRINKSNTPKIYSNILYTPLWFSKDIFDKFTHFPNWSKEDIYFIKYIIDLQGKMLKFEELKQKANINILDFFRVRFFVNRYLKHFHHLKESFQIHPSIPFHIELLYKSKKGNKDFLQILKNEILPMSSNINIWHKKLNTVLNENTWSYIFKLSQSIIDDNYFKWFNLKFCIEY